MQYFTKDTCHQRHGTGIVIDHDGKQFLVRHKNIYVQIPDCCLAFAPVWNGNLDTKDEHEKQ